MNPVEHFNAIGRDGLSGRLGIVVTEFATAPHPRLTLRMPVQPSHHAPHGFLHGGAIAVMADTACGFGTFGNLPEGASGFLTVESKSNHLGAVREGVLECTARARHVGRSTQVWDAEVTEVATGKLVAMFRCTQMLLYAPGAAA
jgi:1,4-dihydroxy-2-naphthoyl-CoA hydrolase